MRPVASAAVALLAVCGFGSGPAAQGWRAEALASFDEVWRVIDATYYDPAFGGLDWAGVGREWRAVVAASETPDQARTAIRTMLARLGQSHFALLSESVAASAHRGGLAVETRVVDGHVVVSAVGAGSSAETAGVRPGDRLVAIDGRATTALDPEAGTGDRASRLALVRAVDRALAGAPGSTVRLDLVDPRGVRRQQAVTREEATGDVVGIGNLPPLRARTSTGTVRTAGGRRAGLIAFSVWMPVVAEPFAVAIDAHREADGLVIDLRGNPGGLAEMIRGLSGHLLDERRLIGRVVMRELNLEIRANPRRSTADGRRVEPFAGPVAVLVDELTGSASECFAGGLQSLGRVRVFGRTTMGQALPAATHELPNGDVLLYAVGDFVTATGIRLEGRGVVPDEHVPLRIDDLAAGRDAALEAALDWIDRVNAAADRGDG